MTVAAAELEHHCRYFPSHGPFSPLPRAVPIFKGFLQLGFVQAHASEQQTKQEDKQSNNQTTNQTNVIKSVPLLLSHCTCLEEHVSKNQNETEENRRTQKKPEENNTQ
jgi:hypothetical protein